MQRRRRVQPRQRSGSRRRSLSRYRCSFSSHVEVLRIFHPLEKETVGWRGCSDFAVVFLREKLRHHVRLPLALADLQHRPDQKTDHVVKKSIGPNVEREATLSLAPRRMRHRATMVVTFRRCTLDGKGAKAVLAADRLRGSSHSRDVDRFFQDQLSVAAKRGGCEIVCAYVVAVAARDRAVPRMELITHFEGCRNPYIGRKNGGHRSSESTRVPFPGHAHSRCLAARVNTSICPPGAHDCDWCSAQFGHRRFELALNRPFVRLPLPAGKARAIVVQHELHGTRQHRVKLAPEGSLSRNVTR